MRDAAPPIELGFVHRFQAAARPGLPTLLLLHGTGGDERDLLDVGRGLLPGAALLSPRGQVSEHGMPRFFRRFDDGSFDVEDLRRRTGELASFVGAAARAHGFDPSRVTAVGYSNGANVAASLLLLQPQTLDGAVLFRATLPLQPPSAPVLDGVAVHLSVARNDPFIPRAGAEQLELVLRESGASVDVRWSDAGHGLTPEDLIAGRRWLTTHLKPQPLEGA